MKSPLKWAGGKSWLVPRIQKIWQSNSDRTYVDPFCGSLAIPLAIQPTKAVLCDINLHLINFWQWIQQNGFVNKIAMENDAEIFYINRTLFNSQKANSDTSAELFYFLNRTCFNGLCRFNRKGEFNVPFGKYKIINYKKNFSEYQLVMKGWAMISWGFAEAIASTQNTDFLYIDPPYDGGGFTGYYGEEFTWKSQVALVEQLAELHNPIVASNAATDAIISLYKNAGFDVELISAPRRISCNGDRSSVLEMFATKNL